MPVTSSGAACGRPTTTWPRCFCPTATSKALARCAHRDQFGDSCENCGSTYTPGPQKSHLRGQRHAAGMARVRTLFLSFEHIRNDAAAWVKSGAVQLGIARKLDEWFAQACGIGTFRVTRPTLASRSPTLREIFLRVVRCADRYLGSLTQLCNRTALKFDDFLKVDSSAELHHFIGKDILYFHTLFWPAVLQASGMRRPPRCMFMAFSPSMARKCPSRAARSLRRAAICATSQPSICAITSPPNGLRAGRHRHEFRGVRARLNSDIVGKLVNIAAAVPALSPRTQVAS